MARERGKDAQTAIKQELEDMRYSKNAELTNRKQKNAFEEMMIAIEDSLSNLASFDDAKDGNDKDDEDSELWKLSEDDQTGWVVGTISKIVQQYMR